MLRVAVLLLSSLLALHAQERIGTVQVRVLTDRADWRYEPGQPVRFRIVAVSDGHVLTGAKVTYRIGPEMMPPKIEQTAAITGEGITVEGGTLNEPGFLRCIATVEHNGRTYRGLATAAFRPEAIKPTQQDPADFDQFWAAGKAALAKLPIDAKVTPLPDYGNAGADCFQVNLQNIGMGNAPSRFYGVLCEPKAPGKYPALLSVPGAGVRPYRGLAEMAARGVITLQVGIHGIPVTMDQSVYDSLGAGALANYNTFGLDNRDRYYYRRVYLGCVRGNDFLAAHPKWDGANLAVTGGWPHMFRATEGLAAHRSPDKIETTRYYDVVNFARRIKVPGLYSWGFNDETCPPTSMYSAYNVIPGEKKLLLALETGHNNIPEQVAAVTEWLLAFLKGGR